MPGWRAVYVMPPTPNCLLHLSFWTSYRPQHQLISKCFWLNSSSCRSLNSNYSSRGNRNFRSEPSLTEWVQAHRLAWGYSAWVVAIARYFVQRTPNFILFLQNSNSLSYRYPMLFPPQSLNSYGDGGQEFASLPPLNNMMGGPEGLGCDQEPNSTDVLDGSESNPNFTKG